MATEVGNCPVWLNCGAGRGQFTDVYLGLWDKDSFKVETVVKQLKDNFSVPLQVC